MGNEVKSRKVGGGMEELGINLSYRGERGGRERGKRETFERGSKSFQGWKRAEKVLVNEKLQRVGVQKDSRQKEKRMDVMSVRGCME